MSLAALARKHSAEAIDLLVQVMRHSRSDAARVSAAAAILDRAYGKPAQSAQAARGDLVGGDLPPARMPTLEEIDAEIKRRGIPNLN
jgi:hypothetical protein